jgi:hypothetical protein
VTNYIAATEAQFLHLSFRERSTTAAGKGDLKLSSTLTPTLSLRERE